VPNGKSGILSPEIYEREKEKFIQTMEEARTLASNPCGRNLPRWWSGSPNGSAKRPMES